MALTKCPACNSDVSQQAESCPACGHPFKKRKRQQETSATTWGCLIFFIIVLVMGWIGSRTVGTGSGESGDISTNSSPQPVCLQPTEEYKTELLNFLPEGSTFGEVQAVRDDTRREMYYVAAEVDTPSRSGVALVGTITISEFGLMQSANDFAASISTMFDGRETQMDLSPSDPAARQALACLEG